MSYEHASGEAFEGTIGLEHPARGGDGALVVGFDPAERAMPADRSAEAEAKARAAMTRQ